MDALGRQGGDGAPGLAERVLGAMLESVSLTTEKGVVVYTNRAYDRMLGCKAGGLLGKHASAQTAYPEEEGRRVFADVTAHLGKRGCWEGDLECIKRDGTLFVARARISRTEFDGASYWLWVQEDVTHERKFQAREQEQVRTIKTLQRVQTELASNLELERIVQTTTDAATSLAGAAFGAFFYNVTDAKGEGYTLYTLSGAPRESFSHFPMPRKTPIFAPTFRGGLVRSDDILKDSRYGKNAPHHGMPPGHLPVRSYLAVPVVGRDGTVHGGLFFGHPEPGRFDATSEEVVSGIAAQTAVALDNAHLYRRAKENEEALRESEHRFRTLVTATTQMVWSTDSNGMIDDMPEWRAFTGQTIEEVRGTGWLDAVHPDDQPFVMETWNRAFAARKMYECEYRVRSRTGEYRHFQARAVPRDAPDGTLIEYIGTWTDVSEPKGAAQEAQSLRAQLIQSEKFAALGQLVSGLAHELRTPLTFLNNNAFLLRQRLQRAATTGESSERAMEGATPFLDEITTGVDRINALVSDLRRYTRARGDASLVVTSLDSVALDTVELFCAANRGTHLVKTSLSPTARVKANVGSFQQLLLNLLQNAVEASPPGRPVRVATRETPEGVVLEVSDEGEGIPEGVLARMFEPLFTTKPEGTGLGLSIIKRIVDEHQARIECDTRIGQGTTFRVIFSPAT